MAEDNSTASISRIVAQSITVIRDGKRHSPEIGKPFKFTKAEISYLEENSPAAIRKAVNEDEADGEEQPEGGDTGTDETAPDGKAGATAKRTPRRGANKAEKNAAKADDQAEDGDAGDDAGDGDGEQEEEETAAEDDVDEDEDI